MTSEKTKLIILWTGIKTEYSAVLIVILTCALILTYDYYQKIEAPNLFPRMELHQQIVDGQAPSPYQYRVLVPWVTEIIRKLLIPLGEERAFRLAYLVYDFTVISFSLFALHLFTSTWFKREQALIGILVASVVMPVTFKDHYFQPWSFLEIGTFSLGLLALYRQAWLGFGLIVFLSSLNRETAVFLPILYWMPIGLEVLQTRRINKVDFIKYARGAAFTLVWLAVFLGLRLLIGSTSHVSSIQDIWLINMQPINLKKTFIAFTLFLGFFWFLVFRGYSKAPHYLRIGMWIVPFYLIVFNIWGYWFETRVLMTLYPILIPTGLCAIFTPATGNLPFREEDMAAG
jgi:hypothetical protein